MGKRQPPTNGRPPRRRKPARPLAWCDDAGTIREMRPDEWPGAPPGRYLLARIVGDDEWRGTASGGFVIARIDGDDDRNTRLHYEVRLASTPDFTNELIYRSDDPALPPETWRLLRCRGDPEAFPSEGVTAWHEWTSEDNDFGVMERRPKGEVGSWVLFDAGRAGAGNRRFYRIRAWDVNDVAEGEEAVSEPGPWQYGIL